MKTFKEMQDAFYTKLRQELLDGLAQCTPANHRIFKLCYAEPCRKLSVEEKESQSIQQVVADMPNDKLPWAMSQVNHTIEVQEERHE